MNFYEHSFINVKRTVKEQAHYFVQGLFCAERKKRNIERMVERLGIEDNQYEAIQHFLTDSNWDSKNLLKQVSVNTSKNLKAKGLVGCTIDEKGFSKKGNLSAGVSRQYNGNKGKIDNCQVGVFLSLCAEKYSTISNVRLFLPEIWTSDEDRCLKAGIPKELIAYKTKPELAVEMIQEHIKDGVHFDFVNGDGLYGHGYTVSKALMTLNKKYVLDVHSNQRIYLEKPEISVPEKQEGRGRAPKLLKANKEEIKVWEYAKKLKDIDYKEVNLRKSTRGWLKAKAHVVKVWVWDEENQDTQAIEQTLVIRKSIDQKEEIKYSLSNIPVEEQSIEMFAFMQGQRFWIEKTFRDGSHDLGMADYQVRKYQGWYNHIVMTAFAMNFVLEQRLKYADEIDLLSYNDIRELLIDLIVNEGRNMDVKMAQMQKRHKQRAKSTSFYEKKQQRK